MIELISAADDESMPALLELNDQVHAALAEYTFVCKNGPRPRSPAKAVTAQPAAALPGMGHRVQCCAPPWLDRPLLTSL